MSEAIKINIVTNPKMRPKRLAVLILLPCGPILFGVLADSTAMQWMGFVFGVMVMLLMVVATTDSNQNLTIEEARKRLDEIERREVSK